MSSPASSPRLVGRYVIHEEFASGGMASLHFGRLVGEIGFMRTVAIKRLHPQHAKDPAFVAMLLDEARLAARIRHPNVVPILDVVAMEGEVFLVMEYVHGESLAALTRVAHLQGRSIPPGITSNVVIGMLHGLAAAHDAASEDGVPLGIVHRDVSPENVLVGADGVSRVLDFGVALAVGRSQVTREGGLKGKLGYMAPEILDGCKATPLSDVYSAGVVLWESLVGRRLFTAEHEGAILALVLRNDVPRPSALAALPSAIDDVVLRACARSPGDRFENAYEFAAALEGCLSPATAREVTSWVVSIAEQDLAVRAEQLARVERAHSGPPSGSGLAGIDDTDPDRAPTAVLPSARGSARTRPQSSRTEVMPRVTGVAPDLSTSPGVTSTQAPTRGRRTRMLGIAGVAAMAAIGALVLAVRSTRVEPATAADGAPIETASPAGAGSVADPSGTAASVEPSEQASASASVDAVASAPAASSEAAPSARPPASTARGTPAVSRPRGGRPSKAPCDPPYTVDDKGHHHYKPGCL